MTDIPIVSLHDMKAHLRVEHSDDDAQILDALAAAQGVVESWCGPLDDFADGVPAALVQAMKMLVAHFYENREATLMEGRGTEMLFGFFDLIDPHRLRAF